MSYFGGYKRGRSDEGFSCPACDDWTDYDESGACGVCEDSYCTASDCLFGPCKECEDHYCEQCIGRCDACEDLSICKGCVEEHLRSCSSQSRAQRMLSAETHAIKEYETTIEEIQRSISSQQARLKQVQAQLEAAKKRKIEAEQLVKDTAGSSESTE